MLGATTPHVLDLTPVTFEPPGVVVGSTAAEWVVRSTLGTVGDKVRNLNRFADDHLWDDTGREWHRLASNLGRDEVENALLDPAIRIGLHDDFGQPVQWIADASKQSVWVEQIQSHFADRGHRTAKARPRSRQPFCASLWESNGQRLLIFERD